LLSVTTLQIFTASSALLPERFLGVAPSATDSPPLQAGFLFSPDDGGIIRVTSSVGNQSVSKVVKGMKHAADKMAR
jgi:hypothetical protein